MQTPRRSYNEISAVLFTYISASERQCNLCKPLSLEGGLPGDARQRFIRLSWETLEINASEEDPPLVAKLCVVVVEPHPVFIGLRGKVVAEGVSVQALGSPQRHVPQVGIVLEVEAYRNHHTV